MIVGAQFADLAQRVSQRCRLTGEFTLRSGQTASTYFDKYLFEGDPGILRDVAELMVPLVPSDTEVLAGLELGGVPVATALSLATGLPAAFVRKVRSRTEQRSSPKVRKSRADVCSSSRT